MFNNIEVELFRFDSKNDYLAYYKKYNLEYNKQDIILDILSKINGIDKFAYKNSLDFKR